ncbi:Hypothetical predicted protein [Xyrichtys novacula]|uniref:Uncharacterized protein n=1 Tax=Xyrichtys novacula TaxID=13765 RepID=A0AAV1GFR1_XYRNO|nr:Hypothetical predicted protein [Xyrichtys novacula]
MLELLERLFEHVCLTLHSGETSQSLSLFLFLNPFFSFPLLFYCFVYTALHSLHLPERLWPCLNPLNSQSTAVYPPGNTTDASTKLQRTFITEQAGPVNVFSLHGPIYPPPVSKRSALSPVKKTHSRGKSSYLPDPLRHA